MDKFTIQLEYDHEELAKRIRERLKTSKSVDIKIFILAESGAYSLSESIVQLVANELRKDGKYSLESGRIGDDTFIVSLKSWRQRHPLGAEIRTGLITFLFSVGAALLLLPTTNRETFQKNRQQDEHLIRLSDSINILQRQITDSLHPLRADSTSLR